MNKLERKDLLEALGLSKDALPYLSPGNSKVRCPIYNVPSRVTCRTDLICSNYCYAKKAERLYPNCLPCRLKNFELSKREDFVKAFYYQHILMLDKNTGKYNKEYFRFHEAGDIYSIEYLHKLYEIISLSPDVLFYTYTKRTDILTPEELTKRPKNFIICYSVDGLQTDIPKEIPSGFDNIAITHPTKTNCPANKTKKCMQNCFKCASAGHTIVFKKH